MKEVSDESSKIHTILSVDESTAITAVSEGEETTAARTASIKADDALDCATVSAEESSNWLSESTEIAAIVSCRS